MDLSGSRTVLVAEDQPDLRHCVRQMLERTGYRVLEAANGAEALVVARGHKGLIDLLLTDIVMPAMDGLVLADQFTRLRPNVPVLYIVGVQRSALAA